jgi:hypothetical protein
MYFYSGTSFKHVNTWAIIYIYIYINYLSNLIYNINYKFIFINFKITKNLYNF